jgi:NAD(P)-dependent dehydrogenase (short-subunit alcohol dehydrogenase family)
VGTTGLRPPFGIGIRREEWFVIAARQPRQSRAVKRRNLQQQTAKADRKKPPLKVEKPVQVGARHYPAPPFPKQHQAKPGKERRLDPAPMYDAPFYEGSHKLKGKVALVTGGDSGIGRAVAVLFAREGADVAIVHLDEPKDADATRQAVEGEGARCLVIAGDVADRNFCRRAVARTAKELGGLDVLVNNAAFQLHASRLEDLSESHFDRTMKTNLYGYFHMAQAAVPYLKYCSAIINTGSVTGIRGNASLLDYSTTKGGIHALTRSLSSHLLPRGIRVNCVAPGPVWTPLNPADREAEQVAQFGSHTPMKRPAQPEEIAPAYVFLASPHCSSFITGEILPIIGGYGS